MSNKQVYTSAYFYVWSYIFAIIALLSAHYQGYTLYITTITAFGIIPIIELFLQPRTGQYEVKHAFLNNLLIVGLVPLHLYLVYTYINLVTFNELTVAEYIGAWLTLGLLCGVYGINVAHELGHRKEKGYQILAQTLLATSLYQHFFIEHNRGHHKRVGTLSDPATARKNETLYQFWYRCITQSFISAYKLEKQRLRNKNTPVFSWNNQFLRFMIVELTLLISIALIWGWVGVFFFVASAIFGMLLLETINYIEHYGLFRNEIANGVYERVNETHSWNSDHVLGRALLFELSRHSNHHENSSRAYYELESMEDSKQLPTGYPGTMILAMIPPLFFKVMNRHLD